MPARLRHSLVIGTLVAVGMSGAVNAAQIKCAEGELSVPDERKDGDNLCLSKAELEKAKKICDANGQKDPIECVCQDGDSVGACGD